MTNKQGKVKTLSQDQFMKQVAKNTDKIASGEDFEFKSDKKGLKIAAAVVGTAAIATGVIYRKEIGKYMKDFTWKKLWNDIMGTGKKVRDTVTGKAKKDLLEKRHATYSKQEAANDAHRYYAQNFEKQTMSTSERGEEILNAQLAFKDYNPVKFMSGKMLENAGLNEKQYKAMKAFANSKEGTKLTAKQKEIIPNWAQDKETCQRYTNAIETRLAEIAKKYA